ncbi:J domain-containing protein [Candidatus Sumerlaeota bacterium]|nr:J domain-containing protein [Candidatus Sumerlaeota bacterium]
MTREIDAYPLCWPEGWDRTPDHQRQSGAFKGTPGAIRVLLLDEVERFVWGRASGAHNWRQRIILSSNVPLRLDGEPYANAREPDDPGVAIYFPRDSSQDAQQICMACDQYNRVWKNMRALQKTMEALRGIERWGSSQLLDRAFQGFLALPDPDQQTWWEVLGVSRHAGEAEIRSAFREKARVMHPDHGGSAESFKRLNDALQEGLQRR